MPIDIIISLPLPLLGGFISLAGDATLVKITYFGWLVKPGGTAIRFYTLNPVPVNIHCRDLFVSYRDLYLLAVGLWEYNQIVIVVLICYLPQLQHHALGASEVRSLALLGPSSLDLWTLSGENCIGGWQQLPVTPVPLQAGLPQQHLFRSLHPLWLEAPRTAPQQECQGPRASDGKVLGTRLPLETRAQKSSGTC